MPTWTATVIHSPPTKTPHFSSPGSAARGREPTGAAEGRWYPQVVGLETGEGTDTLAGARARFFLSGTSTCIIEFDYSVGWIRDGTVPVRVLMT